MSSATVKTIAPVRTSFAGGGTDVEPYCSEHGGCVLSVAIKKYVFAEYPGHPCTELERTIANYFSSEGLAVKHQIPPMSGLGGSASCFVAGIKAVKPELKKKQIAELAVHLERDVMGVAGGKQDQYMASFGGLNMLEFKGKGVKINQLKMPEGLSSLLLLVYMGKRLSSGHDILKDQVKRLNLKALHDQKAIAYQMADSLKQGKLLEFGKLLDAAWHSKMEFTPLIANERIKEFYYQCLKWGAVGGKLTGAGGGGFMALMANPEKPDDLKLNLWQNGIKFERVRFEGKGVRCLETH